MDLISEFRGGGSPESDIHSSRRSSRRVFTLSNSEFNFNILFMSTIILIYICDIT